MNNILIMTLKTYYNGENKYEIGIDEAGRGPMFGRVYTAAVLLPDESNFDHSKMKDSKKFTSKNKINECSDYIKQHALAYSVTYQEPDIIDKINIREATLLSMHNAITNIIKNIESKKDILLLVDGNDFKPYMYFDNSYCNINHVTIKGGDNEYTSIAAASILAKVERDNYIDNLCKDNELLNQYYGISTNKGYGTSTHMEGIKKYGITNLHRKSYGICKTSLINLIIS
tara:strand:+ start:54 stop:740 length:687 start_codon:yes stop_codon:yes gene_type:complete